MKAHRPSGRPARISQADLLDALVAVVVRRGLDEVSIRAVAREAGVSLGAVQYHFPTKDALLHAAYERVIDQFAARVGRLPDPASRPRAYIGSLLAELLPLDAEREAELRIALAFTARSVTSPPLAALYGEGYRALTGAVEAALAQATARGESAPGVDPRRDAVGLVALADGLAWHLLCAPTALDPGEAAGALAAGLHRLLPAEVPRAGDH